MLVHRIIFLILLLFLNGHLFGQHPWTKINKPYIPILIKALESDDPDSLRLVTAQLVEQYNNDDLLVGLRLKYLAYNQDTVEINKYLAKALEIKGTFSLDALGYYYHNENDTWLARNYYDKSFLADSLHINYSVLLDLGYLEEDNGYLEQATKYFQFARYYAPKEADVLIELVSNYIKRGMYVEAIEILDTLHLNRLNERILLSKGQAYQGIGDYVKAEEMFKKLVQINPGNIENILNLFDLTVFRLKDMQKSKIILSDLMTKFPDSSQTKMCKAIILSEERQFNESNLIYKSLIKTKPIITYYGGLSINLIKSHEYKEALLYLDEALMKFGNYDEYGSNYQLELLKVIALKGVDNVEKYNSFVDEMLNSYGEVIFEHLRVICNDVGIQYDDIFR